MKYFLFAQVLMMGLILVSCLSQQEDEFTLRSGDILFQDLNCGPLCDAIETVTWGTGGRDFSHCGLVVERGDSIYVLEAIGEKVQLTPLRRFFARSGDTDRVENILAGRFDGLSHELREKAAQIGLRELGKPYDDVFLPNNDAWYCSELVAYAYNEAAGRAVFEPAPMTFRAPGSQTFLPVWKRYFDSLKVEIPEGMPGFNPGALSRHPALRVFIPLRAEDHEITPIP
ncbi:MAG: YiiX/YebB-like N1pC/P60 family cysteine hydrolase [Flavobacteriales bacterium]|nr:YiiX/YebB-like N1pC/P60 family cysteine hydrolase [Flavobacteriales bacterium]MDW8410355.1 YiiX/YebB-like N1pC/P60 family cysteine hydrolase [Flavobacteriales bacterium]